MKPESSYPLSIVPAVVGILAGAAVASASAGDSPLDAAYLRLPEYHVWRLVIVAQVSGYFTVAAYLWRQGRARASRLCHGARPPPPSC